MGDKELVVTPFLAKGFFKFAMPHLRYDVSQEKREYPFKDRCSRLVQISETMTIPTGFTSAIVPNDRSFLSDPISFDGSYKLENSKIEFKENVRLGKRVYEASDWPAFRQAVLNQQFYMDTPVILTR